MLTQLYPCTGIFGITFCNKKGGPTIVWPNTKACAPLTYGAVACQLCIEIQKHPLSSGEQSVKGNTLNELLEQMRPAAITPKRVMVRRECIFSDSVACFKQRNYNFNVPVRITFEGEPAIDGGGPMREFFTLLMRELLSPSADIRLFEGRNLYHLPLHNTDALRSNLFKVAGRMVTASVIQGGPGFPVFSKAVYLYFQNPNPHGLVEHVTKEDVVDMEVVDTLNKVQYEIHIRYSF